MEGDVEAHSHGHGLAVFLGGFELPLLYSFDGALVQFFVETLADVNVLRDSLGAHHEYNRHGTDNADAVRCGFTRRDLFDDLRRSHAGAEFVDLFRRVLIVFGERSASRQNQACQRPAKHSSLDSHARPPIRQREGG
jgi:hypothetical protein